MCSLPLINRFTPQRKAALLGLLALGTVTQAEVINKYQLTVEELDEWKQKSERLMNTWY